MKRNWIVSGGVGLLIVTGIFIPIASFTQKAFYMDSMEKTRLTNSACVLVGLIILWFMQSNSKWRGVLWILLSVLGMLLTFSGTRGEYERVINRELRIDPNYPYGPLSYDSGISLIVVGFLIVIAGSVWDIIQKQKSILPSQTVNGEVSSN